MKYLKKQLFLNRLKFINFEKQRQMLSYFLKNNRYQFEIKYNRIICPLFFFKQNQIFSFHKNKLKNRCGITNRGRSILTFVNLSRITFREYVSKGYIIGYRKSSW